MKCFQISCNIQDELYARLCIEAISSTALLQTSARPAGRLLSHGHRTLLPHPQPLKSLPAAAEYSRKHEMDCSSSFTSFLPSAQLSP